MTKQAVIFKQSIYGRRGKGEETWISFDTVLVQHASLSVQRLNDEDPPDALQ